MTKKATLENAIRWVKELKANAEPNINIMLVGNKIDLCRDDSEQRQVTTEEGAKVAEEFKAMFAEASAIQDLNVKSAFEDLLQSKRS